jgi:hypothetical protein
MSFPVFSDLRVMLSTQSGPYAPNQLQGGEADHMLHLATRLSERGLDVNVLTA